MDDAVAIFSLNGTIPLLIGQGPPPKVWLSIPQSRDAISWVPLIKENFSSHPDVTVNATGKRVVVKVKDKTVLHVMHNASDDLTFFMLDLRPFGLNVFTGDDKLHVMGSTLSGNTFKNVPVAISVESQPGLAPSLSPYASS